MAPRFEALNRLFEAVRDGNHDFRATTDIFPPVDPEKRERTLELTKKGTANGASDNPAPTSKELDEVEREVVDGLLEDRDSAYRTVSEQFGLYAQRLRNLDFQDKLSLIEQANNTSVNEFKGNVTTGRDQLFVAREKLKTASDELKRFKKNNVLERAARPSTTTGSLVKFAIVLAVLLIETVTNGVFLSGGSDLGVLGGVVIAFAFAFINVIWTVIVTHFGVKQINRKSFLWKVVGLLGFAAYVVMAVVINVVMANYREVSAGAFSEVGQLVMDRVKSSPFNFTDIETWALFAVGIVFSLITFVDVLLWGDPHPGYGGVYKRYQKALLEYVDRREDEIERLKEIRDEHNEMVDGIIKELSARRREHGVIVAGRSNLAANFEEYQKHLERVANQLLGMYREANRKARSKTPPKRFSQSFRIDLRSAPSTPGDEWKESELAESIAKAQSALTEQMREMAREFDSAVDQYRKLDNLFPEDEIGYAATQTA